MHRKSRLTTPWPRAQVSPRGPAQIHGPATAAVAQHSTERSTPRGGSYGLEVTCQEIDKANLLAMVSLRRVHPQPIIDGGSPADAAAMVRQPADHLERPDSDAEQRGHTTLLPHHAKIDPLVPSNDIFGPPEVASLQASGDATAGLQASLLIQKKRLSVAPERKTWVKPKLLFRNAPSTKQEYESAIKEEVKPGSRDAKEVGALTLSLVLSEVRIAHACSAAAGAGNRKTLSQKALDTAVRRAKVVVADLKLATLSGDKEAAVTQLHQISTQPGAPTVLSSVVDAGGVPPL
eukprot:2708959-Pleurochrysis_carterae.AAC.1